MIGSWRDEYRTRALQLLTLLLVVSFAAIPVRCDASMAPHSIFVDPVAMDADADRQSDAAPVDNHHHHAGMHDMAGMTADVADDASSAAQDGCVVSMTAGTDLHSQQPVGAAFDLPTTPVPPVASALLPIEGELVVFASASTMVLTGIMAPPEAPPPKSA